MHTPKSFDVASSIVAAANKATPVDADSIGLVDSVAGNILKELTWANIKATLKAYFDTLYSSVPSGIIFMWHGLIANIPAGYVLCDGNNSTPDLREKFVRGAPAATEAGGTGGADTHTLTVAQIPSHAHTVPIYAGSGPTAYLGNDNTYYQQGATSGSTGGGGSHNNMPAYYQILFIMKT